jgi:hypothetical protein
MSLAVVLMSRTAEAYRLLGPGGTSCGSWSEDRLTDIGLYQIDVAWVLGFLTAVGYMGEGGSEHLNPLGGLDSPAVAAWVDNYCQTHPLDDIQAAAKAFIDAHPR